MTALLQTTDLTVRYGGLCAVDGLALTVEEGQLVGLIGPNGAGKTSAVDAITGFTPASGSILFTGREIGRLKSHDRARAGLARTWQSAEIFGDLSVVANVQVAAEVSRRRWDFFVDMIRPNRRLEGEDVTWVLELLDIRELEEAMPSELSHGQTKLVGIARALAGRPQVLLLDEPAAGLDTQESRILGRRLRVLRERGTGLLLIDHDIDLVAEVCDYIYVLDFGRRIAEGTPREVLRSQTVIDAYLGAGAHARDHLGGAT